MNEVKPNIRKMIDIIQDSIFLKLPAAKNILNLGAADGNFIEKYPWQNYTLVNVDNNSEDGVFEKECISKYTDENITNIVANCYDLNMLKDNTFDMVIFTHLIEHLNDEEIEKTLLEIKRVLKPNGIMFTSTPNKKVRKYFESYKANQYHVEEFTFEEFSGYVSPHFQIIKIFGALWLNVNTNQLVVGKIDDPENSYVMMLMCKNDKNQTK